MSHYFPLELKKGERERERETRRERKRERELAALNLVPLRRKHPLEERHYSFARLCSFGDVELGVCVRARERETEKGTKLEAMDEGGRNLLLVKHGFATSHTVCFELGTPREEE